MPDMRATDEGRGVSRFDKFMVHVDIGTDEKLAHLTDTERLCHIAGVLAIAAKSPIRGRLLVGDMEAGAGQVGRRAGLSERVATSTIRKLVEVGVLVRDEEYDCWRVHNWERFNPEPRPDNTGADRQARYRERLREKSRSRAIKRSVKDEVMERDEARCVACGSDGPVEYHHRVAVADGGGNEASNLELRCPTCHRDAHRPVTSRRDTRDGDAAETLPRVGATAIACARSPEGKEVEDEVEETTALSDESDLDRARTRLRATAEQQVFDMWIESTGRTGSTQFSTKRRRLIRQALHAYPTQDVLDAVCGWKISPHHRGENEQHTTYNDLELLLRDAQHIEKFRDLHRNGQAAEPRGDGFGERLKARTIR